MNATTLPLERRRHGRHLTANRSHHRTERTRGRSPARNRPSGRSGPAGHGRELVRRPRQPRRLLLLRRPLLPARSSRRIRRAAWNLAAQMDADRQHRRRPRPLCKPAGLRRNRDQLPRRPRINHRRVRLRLHPQSRQAAAPARRQPGRTPMDSARIARTVRPDLGIIGYGGIGEACAKLAQAFGMRTIATKRRPPDDTHLDRHFPPDRLHDLLAASDYVVLCCPPYRRDAQPDRRRRSRRNAAPRATGSTWPEAGS